MGFFKAVVTIHKESGLQVEQVKASPQGERIFLVADGRYTLEVGDKITVDSTRAVYTVIDPGTVSNLDPTAPLYKPKVELRN